MKEICPIHNIPFQEELKNGVYFDKEQEKTGFNKFGHYQSGYQTCIICKSDNTSAMKGFIDGIQWKWRECNVCNAKFNSQKDV